MPGSRKKMKPSHRHGFFFYIGMLLLALLLVGGSALFIVAPQVLKAHRDDIMASLSKTLGRKVQIDGDMGLALSWRDGISLSVKQVSIGNPSWASRPVLAKVDRLALGVGLAPLFDHVIEIRGFALDGADVLLETSRTGQTNWDFSSVKKETPAAQPEKTETAVKTQEAGRPFTVRLRADGIAIVNSEIGIRSADGSVSRFQAEKLSIFPKGSDETDIHFVGTLADYVVKMDATTGALEKVMTSNWPVKAAIDVGGLTVVASGSVRDGGKEIVLDSYQLAGGQTRVGGKMLIDLRGVKPSVSGTLAGDKFAPSDLKPQKRETAAAPVTDVKPATSPADATRVFSSEVLPLDGLRAVDAVFSVTIGLVDLGNAQIQDLKSQITLKNGALTVSPLQMKIGGSLAEGHLALNAGRVPAALEILFKANKVDLPTLAQLGGVESVMSGKGTINVDLNATGNSPHAMASSLSGQVNLLVATGTLYGKTMEAIGGALTQLIGGSGNNPALNCMAARYVFQNGLMRSDGVVLDSDLVTIGGTGGIDFRDERIDMRFEPQGKGKGLGDLTPPVHVTGTLAAPSYGIDTGASVSKVAGLLSQGLNVFKQQNAQTSTETNACAAYVDKKATPTSTTGTLTQGLGDVLSGSGSAGSKIEGVGNQLMKNLGNGLLKGF